MNDISNEELVARIVEERFYVVKKHLREEDGLKTDYSENAKNVVNIMLQKAKIDKVIAEATIKEAQHYLENYETVQRLRAEGKMNG